MKIINLALQPFLYAWLFFLFTIILVPISVVALPFSQAIRTKLTTPFWNLTFNMVVKFVFFARITKIDQRPINAKSISPKGLYIANHQNFSDIPLVFSHITIPPIMKKEVLVIPVLGICAYSSGGILVDRKNKDSRKYVFEESKKRLISGRKQLFYFPEGTRQKPGLDPKPINEIKKPLLEFAFKENISVYPISIEGTPNVLVNGKIQLFKKLGIFIHKEISPKDFEQQEEFVSACWEQVLKGKKELSVKVNS